MELRAGQFKAEALAVEKKIDDIDDKVEELDRDITRIPPDAARAATALKLLGGDVNSVGDKVTSLGEKNTGLAALDSKIRSTRTEIRKLADEFTRTGDVDVFRRLGDAEGHLRGLQVVRKRLAEALIEGAEDAAAAVAGAVAAGLVGAGESAVGGILGSLKAAAAEAWGVATQVGEKIGGAIEGGISGALSNPVLGPIITAALIAGIVVDIPLILAAVGGAILAAAGGGAVGLGLMGAMLGDPQRIGDAWKAEFAGIKDDLINASTGFRDPMVHAAHAFGNAVRDIHLDQILAKALTYLGPLVTGAADLTRYLGQGLGALVDGAGPVMKVIGDELPKIGMAFKDALTSIAAGGEGGAQALKDILQVTERVIVALGDMIEVGEKVYGTLAKFRDAVLPRDWLFTEDAPARVMSVGRALDDVGRSMDTTTGSALDLGAAIRTGLNGPLTEMRNNALAAADANLALAEGWLRLRTELTEGKRTLDTNTQSGIDNARAIVQQVENAERYRQQQIALNGDVDKANATYAQNVAQIRQMAYALGYNKQQVDNLIASLDGLPPTTTAAVKTPGLFDAIGNAAVLAAKLGNIEGSHYANVYVNYHTRGQSLNAPLAHGGIRHAATGMIVAPSDPGTLIGEPQTGGEALIPLRGIPQSRALDLMQTVGSGYGISVSAGGGGARMPRTLVLQATFIDPVDASVTRRQTIQWSLDHGRDPGTSTAR